MSIADLIGKRFGRLTVIGNAPPVNKKLMVNCRCDCGKEKDFQKHNILSGHSKSCGCLRRDTAASSFTTHGHSRRKTGTYDAWTGMKKRCTNPKEKCFHNYGGRGISVCDRWLNSFENFLADMGEKPDRMSIDRINNDGNYEPGNCRWATLLEQANNCRSNRVLTFNGKTQTLSQWGRDLGIDRKIISDRLRRGWSIEDSLTRKLYERTG